MSGFWYTQRTRMHIFSYVKKHKTFFLSIGFLVVFVVTVSYATPPASPYNPGDTLDPGCAPGTTNCTVTVGGGGANPWDTVTNGINYAGGSVGIGTTTPSAALDVAGTIISTGLNVSGTASNATVTVDDPSNLQAAIDYDPSNTQGYQYIADGSHTQINYHVYAYKIVGTARVYSSSFTTLSSDLSDNSSGDPYAVSLSWDAVPGANGYRVIFSDGGAYDQSYDTNTNSLLDDGCGSVCPSGNVDVSRTSVNVVTNGTVINGGLTADLLMVNDTIIAAGQVGSGDPVSDLGAGSRMMWIPSAGAFRAGAVDANQWDSASVGQYSAAFGFNTVAASANAVAFGYETSASGVMNRFHDNISASTAFGYQSTASGGISTAFGYQSLASGKVTTAFGQGTIASGDLSTAFGFATTASGVESVSFGEGTTASGFISTAFGQQTNANAYDSTAFGQYNVGGGDPDNWVATDPLFEIGNGVDTSNLSNALTILKNGNVGIGVATPQYPLDVTGTSGVGINYDDPAGHALMRVNGGGSFQAGYYIFKDGNEISQIAVMGDSNDLSFNMAGTERMRLTAGGFLGIGTSTIGSLLTVGDGTTPSGNVAHFQTSAAHCDLDPTTTGGLTCSSDMNLKTGIANLADNSPWNFNTNISANNQSVFAKVLALQPVQYVWRSDPSGVRHDGFIAQEVQQVFPELVSTDSSGSESLNYTGLIPYTVEAIKEMNLNITSINDLTKTNTWRDALINWFASTTNGIGDFVANRLKAKNEVCINDTCINETQLKQLLQSAPAQGSGATQTDNQSNGSSDRSASTQSEQVQSPQVSTPEVSDPSGSDSGSDTTDQAQQ